MQCACCCESCKVYYLALVEQLSWGGDLSLARGMACAGEGWPAPAPRDSEFRSHL